MKLDANIYYIIILTKYIIIKIINFNKIHYFNYKVNYIIEKCSRSFDILIFLRNHYIRRLNNKFLNYFTIMINQYVK